jgi:hypothetical protein
MGIVSKEPILAVSIEKIKILMIAVVAIVSS